MWGNTTTWQQLSESISRLRLLNKVPKRPKENSLVSKGNSYYYLSLLRENEIASNLAFLLAISDNSLKVIAIYIKEYFNRKRITIRVILNTRDLLIVISGFRIFAKTLKYTI